MSEYAGSPPELCLCGCHHDDLEAKAAGRARPVPVPPPVAEVLAPLFAEQRKPMPDWVRTYVRTALANRKTKSAAKEGTRA